MAEQTNNGRAIRNGAQGAARNGRRNNVNPTDTRPPRRKIDASAGAARPVNYGRQAARGQRMNIREQTPSMRRSAREAKRIDPNVPEIRRGAKRAQGYKIKKKNKNSRWVFIARAVLFAFVFMVMSAIIGLGFYLNLSKKDGAEYDRIRLKLGLDYELEQIESKRVDVGQYYRGGVMYMDLTAVSKAFGFIVTGDRDELRYIADEDSGENFKVSPGSNTVCVNGVAARLSGAVYYEGNSVFIPVSFFEEYANGVGVEFDEEKSVLSIFRKTSKNQAGRRIESDISFKLKVADSLDCIDENLLPQSIKDKTYFANASSTGD